MSPVAGLLRHLRRTQFRAPWGVRGGPPGRCGRSAGLPAPVVECLTSEIAAIIGSQEMRSRLGEQGSDPVGSTPQEFAAFVTAEQPKWAELVRISGATID